MLGAVHRKSCRCSGPLGNPEMGGGRSDYDTFSAECLMCGAVFGHLAVEKPDSKSLSLGCLLAGGSFEQFVMSQEMGNMHSATDRTLRKHIDPIVVAVDEAFDEMFRKVRMKFKCEKGRKKVKIPLEKHFLASNMTKILERLSQGVGVKVGC